MINYKNAFIHEEGDKYLVAGKKIVRTLKSLESAKNAIDKMILNDEIKIPQGTDEHFRLMIR